MSAHLREADDGVAGVDAEVVQDGVQLCYLNGVRLPRMQHHISTDAKRTSQLVSA